MGLCCLLFGLSCKVGESIRWSVGLLDCGRLFAGDLILRGKFYGGRYGKSYMSRMSQNKNNKTESKTPDIRTLSHSAILRSLIDRQDAYI